MDIVLSEGQEMLKRSARELLRAECSSELVRAMESDERGYPPQLWQRMAQLGWLGLPFPQRYGGGGGSFFDLALLVEELGRRCATFAREVAVHPLACDPLELAEQMELRLLTRVPPLGLDQPLGEMEENRGPAHFAGVD